MSSYEKIWEIIHKALKEKYPKDLMDLWLSKLELVYLDENTADFVIPDQDDYFINIINANYSKSISDMFYSSLNMNVDVHIYSSNSYVKKTPKNDIKSSNDALFNNSFVETSNDLDLDSKYISNFDYTFENFIVGNSNKFAYNACLSITKDLASNYNPLFIYGESGLGKTHLMKAIVNRLKVTNPNLKYIYISGENFTNEFIDSIRKKTTDSFKEKYRNTDVLLIDDIQYISGKEQTQLEFFHTFNELYDAHKQIVLTSDKAPKYLSDLTSRLETRFEGGLIVDIQPPDTELKIAILQSKAKAINLSLPNEIVVYIVENVSGSIRKLEGVIKRISAYCYINNNPPITLNLVQSIIEPYIDEKIRPDEIANKIIKVVSVTYNISIDDLKGQSRKANIVHARNIAIYAIREKTNMALESIGKLFGKRDHTTIINSIDRIEKEKSNDSSVEKELQEIYKDIYEQS